VAWACSLLYCAYWLAGLGLERLGLERLGLERLGLERLGLHLEIRHAIENSNRFEPGATEMLYPAALHR
jgi:hypothetical protein